MGENHVIKEIISYSPKKISPFTTVSAILVAICRMWRIVSQRSEAKNQGIVASGEKAAYLCIVERNKRLPEERNKRLPEDTKETENK